MADEGNGYVMVCPWLQTALLHHGTRPPPRLTFFADVCRLGMMNAKEMTGGITGAAGQHQRVVQTFMSLQQQTPCTT